MDSESSLYQKVWGEPGGAGQPSDPARASIYDLDPLAETARYSTELPESSASWAYGEEAGLADTLILRILEQIEERISQIRRSETESRQLFGNGFAQVTDAVQALESRMTRLENGVVRSLEYLESRIEELGR